MQETDLLIIGGGINGVGIAADAAQRGLKVVLCEQADLASATSSASSKLIHGGLRYLEQYRFHLVKESLRERSILLQRAPHLVRPLKFILPYNKVRGAWWKIYAGLKLYDFLTPKNHLEKTHSFKINADESPLKKDYRHVFSYFDCQTDDARLVVLNAQLAKTLGAEILTHTQCVEARAENGFWILSLKSTAGEQQLKAKAVINAAGPWAPYLIGHLFALKKPVDYCLVKGSHIVIPKLYEKAEAYILPHADGRVVFTIPYEEKYSLIGTTDINVPSTAFQAAISEEEVTYLIGVVNFYFKKQITRDQIIWSYSGLRCLVGNSKANPSQISREHMIETQLSEGAPLFSLYGGKLTTYRAVAAELVDKLKLYFPALPNCSIEKLSLPGGNLGMSFEDFILSLSADFPWLSKQLVRRYAGSYGKLSYKLLSNCKSLVNLGINFGSGLYQAEVDYLRDCEWAKSVDDILWRRSKLGLEAKMINIKQLSAYLEGREYA